MTAYLHKAAPRACQGPPRNEEPTEALAGTGGFGDQGKTRNSDSESTPATEQQGAADSKRFATLRARLALAGWTLTRTSAADSPVVFFATRWNKPRELAGLDAVAKFASMVGAPE
jgi:hypothetical protein